MCEYGFAAGISIHALRGEGDRKLPARNHAKKLISIHALRGEGDLLKYVVYALRSISIHALRGEGDTLAKYSK